MSEIKNGRSGLYGAEHSKCNHLTTLGFKWLTQRQEKERHSAIEKRTVVPCILLSAPVILSISSALAASKSSFLSSLYFCAISPIIASISLTVKFLLDTPTNCVVSRSMLAAESRAVNGHIRKKIFPCRILAVWNSLPANTDVSMFHR